jgi:hypothetical protein
MHTLTENEVELGPRLKARQEHILFIKQSIRMHRIHVHIKKRRAAVGEESAYGLNVVLVVVYVFNLGII